VFSAVAQKLSPLGAWSGASFRLRVGEPAGGGWQTLLKIRRFRSYSEVTPRICAFAASEDTGILPDHGENIETVRRCEGAKVRD
jgi:hypothetical protein